MIIVFQPEKILEFLDMFYPFQTDMLIYGCTDIVKK
jgi:hypothetical protein